jgi:hypothetical protein
MNLKYEKAIYDFHNLLETINDEGYKNKFSHCVYDVPENIHLLNLYYLNENNQPIWMTIAVKGLSENEVFFEIELHDTNVSTLKRNKYHSIEEVKSFLDEELLKSKGFYDWRDFYKTNYYKITQVTHYDDVELHIVVGYFESTEEEINEIANKNLRTILREDGLHISYGNDYFVVSDDEKDKYHFEICTKDLPQPIDARTITKDEIDNLLNDERYMTTPDDFEIVDWNLSKAYTELKRNNPEKKAFSFSSLAYGIEKIPETN